MVGHGSPRTSRGRVPPAARVAAAAWRLGCALTVWLLTLAVATADDFQVRIAWGGGVERRWTASISLGEGSLANPRLLGVEADEPGSMWLDGPRTLVIRQRSPRSYDGVDLTISAPRSVALRVRMSDADEPSVSKTIEIPLEEIYNGSVNRELDGQGNRLTAARAPGDHLRVRIAQDHLVFSPGETLHFVIEPRGLPSAGGAARIKVELLGGGKQLWSSQHDTSADREEPIPIEVKLPDDEGVYDIAVTAVGNPNWSQAVRQPLSWKRTIAERRVQLVVIDSRRPEIRGEQNFTQLVEIDPANPRWFEILNDKLNRLPQLPLTKNPLPRRWRGPLGNDCMTPRRHSLGELAELRPNADSPDVSWEAYWLPISHPGRPHIVEVEYPSDVGQTLNLCVLEPDAAGAMAPIGVNSGVDNAPEAGAPDAAPRWERHRIVFWPRTSTPLLLVSNGRERSPAVYGKIRVLADGKHLPRATPVGRKSGRLLAAYLDRPLIPESFAANECLDPASGRSLQDWRTFHEGGTRLVEYLRYAGYNGLMLTVLADGSAIYPSRLAEPTPRYDTGVFFATGQDPMRKDVLEMLFRLFDREELRLIPAVEFASPLPELEALRRAGRSAAEGIEWVGPEGKSWRESRPTRRGLAPYYNVLDPRVQAAMLRVVHELASRYAEHSSFAGVAVRLSADGYAQLPGPEWGLDDTTIARFERDTGYNVPGRGSSRFAQRAAFLSEPTRRQAWLQWRAEQLAHFHAQIHDELASIRPDSRLYLATAGMMDGPALEAELRPALPRKTNVASALLSVGIDGQRYVGTSRRIVLLRPEGVVPRGELGSHAVEVELGQMADIDRYFQTSPTTGSLFFRRPREVHIESLDRKSPVGPGFSWLLSQSSPSGHRNRRRFVHSLATLDSQAMFDGGWVIATGQEAAVGDVAAAFRTLPDVRFETVGNSQGDDSSQPVTFRQATHGGRTYLYAVNDAPFAVTARLRIDAGPACRIKELTGRRKIEPLASERNAGMQWEVKLEPYDLVAVELSEPNVTCRDPRVVWPGGVELLLGSRIRQLGVRAATLRNPAPLDALANAGFERSPDGDSLIADWAVTTRKGVRVELDADEKHGGRQSAKIASDGPVACLVSRPMTAPGTGRLAVSVWLRTADVARQPPLRLAIEGRLGGRDYYRFAPVGLAPAADQPAEPIQSQWRQYVFQVDDLPLEGLSQLRARFDLMGPGEVWVDDVQVFSLAFSRMEMVELSKIITLADVKLQNGQISDCLRLLEGYWPRFLEENVPLPAGATVAQTASRPESPKKPDEEPPPESDGLLNRLKGFLPESLRR